MKILDKLLITLVVIFIVSIIIAFIFPENIEIRNRFYQIIFDSYIIIISLLFLLILLVLKGFFNLIHKKRTEGFILIFIPRIVIFFCGFFSLYLWDILEFSKKT
ncbi:hypothetical protein CXF59_04040 [Flavobacterium sp. ALD4]|nr:hypothetical protein CXF59_04040 [Flavobacterium sp. ALD4]